MSLVFCSLAFIGDIGGGEIGLIFLVVLMLFGGEKMPELARGLGRAIREFKKATAGVEEQIKRAMEEPPPKPRTQAPQIPPVYTPPPSAITPITPIDPEPAPIAPAQTPAQPTAPGAGPSTPHSGNAVPGADKPQP